MKFYGIYPGLVIQNNDPEKAGRVKVFVPGITNTIYEGWNDLAVDKEISFVNGVLTPILQGLRDSLPWAQNVSPLFGGGCDSLSSGGAPVSLSRPSGTFSIPNVGATTYAFFIGGDINCPAFFGISHGSVAWTSALGASYPSTHENTGGGGYVNKHIINTNKHYIELIDDNGAEEIRVFSAKDRNVTITNNDTVLIGGDWNVAVAGDINITATGSCNIKGSTINLN